MPSARLASSLAVASSLMALSACGSRSALTVGRSAEEGGSGGTTTTTTTSSTTLSCDQLVVQPNWLLYPIPSTTRPQLANLAGTPDVLFTALATDFGDSWVATLRLQDPWSSWPPPHEEGKIIEPALNYVMATGPETPLLLVQEPDGSPSLAHHDGLSFTQETFASLQFGEPLFVAGVPGRILAATGLTFEPFHELSIGSLQPGNLPQSEEPLLCTSTPTLAAGVASGTGFLTAIAEVDPIENDCLSGPDKAAALRVMVRRYESPSEPGSSLEMSTGDGVSNSEPIARVAMTPASFGAWVLYQTDGSTALQMPPIMAFAVDPKGHMLSPNGPFAVSPSGVDWPFFAAATMAGDNLLVAHVQTFDTSAPDIVLALFDANGAQGLSATIPTGDAWLGGRVALSPSADGRSLLVAWEVSQEKQRVALTRVDCVTAL